MMRCPSCQEIAKQPKFYLCRVCWMGLSPVSRHRLSVRDSRAGVRLIELHHQLADEVPLSEIQISA